MTARLLSVETPALAADHAAKRPLSVAVDISAPTIGVYGVTEITRTVLESFRVHRVGVADDPTRVTEIVPAALVLPGDRTIRIGRCTGSGDLLLGMFQVVEASPIRSYEGIQSSSVVGPCFPFVYEVKSWRRMILAETGYDCYAQVYLSSPADTRSFAPTPAVIEAPWLEALEAKIRGFAAVEAGRCVTETTANRAVAVLRQIPSDLPGPQVRPSVDGDVLLLWYNQGDHVEVNVDADGHTNWFGKFSGTYEPGGDADEHSVLPLSLQEMLRRLLR